MILKNNSIFLELGSHQDYTKKKMKEVGKGEKPNLT
jgi:hypothetical protein